MNREQAEHILDAYVRMRMRESDKDASDALREVILDAMTEYRSSGITVSPGITWPSTKPMTVPTYHQRCYATEIGAAYAWNGGSR